MRNVPTTGVSGNLLVALYFASKAVPMMIAGVTIYLGFKLFVLGVTGQASIVINAQAVTGQLLNAAPGLFFSVGGVVALIVTVWKGSSFTFARHDPFESYALCIPTDKTRLWHQSAQPQQEEALDPSRDPRDSVSRSSDRE